jgi:hypothetical protein
MQASKAVPKFWHNAMNFMARDKPFLVRDDCIAMRSPVSTRSHGCLNNATQFAI